MSTVSDIDVVSESHHGSPQSGQFLLWPVDRGTAVIICNCKNDVRLINKPGIKNINTEDSGLLQCDAESLGEQITMLLRIWEGQTVQELLDPAR